MAKSTEGPFWIVFKDRGGYAVQPVATPEPTKNELSNKIPDGIKNQNLNLFNRGKIISVVQRRSGINHLPNPPIKMGITKKKSLLTRGL